MTDIDSSALKAELAANMACITERRQIRQRLVKACDQAREQYRKADQDYLRFMRIKGNKRTGRPEEWLGLKGHRLTIAVEVIHDDYATRHPGKRQSDAWAIGELVKFRPWADFQSKKGQRVLASRLVRARGHWALNTEDYRKKWYAKRLARERAWVRYGKAVKALREFATGG